MPVHWIANTIGSPPISFGDGDCIKSEGIRRRITNGCEQELAAAQNAAMRRTVALVTGLLPLASIGLISGLRHMVQDCGRAVRPFGASWFAVGKLSIPHYG